MSEELEFRRRLAEHERRFLRPARVDLDELAATLRYRGDEPGAALWARAIAGGIIPADWSDDPERRFRATGRELRRLGIDDAELVPDAGGRARHLLAAPASARAALLFASDPAGLLAAEELAREVAARLEIWGAPHEPGPIAWRLAGNPVDRRQAGGPPLGALRLALVRVRAALDGAGRIYEPPHHHRRFQVVADALQWSRRRELLREAVIPAVVRVGAGEVRLPEAVVGRTLAELPDPFAPWLELSLRGYSLWAISEGPGGAVLELAAPFPPPRRLAPERRPIWPAKRDRAEREFPRAVWSSRLTALRLACARGDPGAVRRGLPLLVADDEPRQPRLIHFAVYGGPEVLAALAEGGHCPLEARDGDDRTALMLAAVVPREGPAGASRAEIDVPISDIVGAASCEWLLAAGADSEARDELGRTALHLGAREGRLRAVAALLRGGATVDAIDRRGRTPLMHALTGGRVFPLLGTSAAQLIELLLDAGADPDRRDVHGWNALHYLAAAGVEDPRALARLLEKRGARPNRDRAGRSPADLHALTQRGPDRRGGPLDPETPVAAGPGPMAIEFEPSLADELVAELIPGPAGIRRGPDKPGTGEIWMVWADWLQSRGDPRGELVATSLARARVGSRHGRELDRALTRVTRRCDAALRAALDHADPLAPVRRSPIELRRTHGFVTWARLSGLEWGRRSGVEGPARIAGCLVEAARMLLRCEPLLAELRLGVEDPQSWSILLAGLRSLEPAPRLRRLVFERLPAAMPELVDLEPLFPGLRSLWLLGAGKLNRGFVRWPGVAELRLRHGDTSEWTQGGVDLELELDDLSHLDLGLPVGMRTVAAEIEGCAATLTRLERVRHLRLGPLAPDFAAAIFAGPVLDRLATLELVGVRGQTLELLLRQAPRLRRLERVRVGVSPAVAEQRADELAELRGEVPGVQLLF